MIDRYGSSPVSLFGTVVLIAVIYVGFIGVSRPTLVIPVFAGFMFAMSIRNVAYNTLTSKVPPPSERARFMSIQSAIQHIASSSGAFVSSLILTESPDGKLEGIATIAVVSMVLAALVPVLVYAVERRLHARHATVAG